jgi:outer membrane protein assembly factor BamD (BamD/ComL family)
MRLLQRTAALAAMLFLGACAMLNGATTPKASDEWPSTLSLAQARVNRGEFDAADSLLASFAARHPGSSEAHETAYWRGLFKMDPSNRNASLTSALASLDGYLADNRRRDHVPEATTLRRAAAQLSELNKLAANAMSQARDANRTAANASATAADAKDAKAATADANADAQAEIKRLKDELAKANAELDRIRKRLSQPPPHP